MAPFGSSRRKCQAGGGRKDKGSDKCSNQQEISLQRLKAKKKVLEAKIRAREAEVQPDSEPEEADKVPRDDSLIRQVVKFFWLQLNKPTDPDEWQGVDGVISVIRRRMGDGAPRMETVRKVLKLLAEDEEADLDYREKKGGRPRTFSEEDYPRHNYCDSRIDIWAAKVPQISG